MQQATTALRAVNAPRIERITVSLLFISSLEQMVWQRLKEKALTSCSAWRPMSLPTAATAP